MLWVWFGEECGVDMAALWASLRSEVQRRTRCLCSDLRSLGEMRGGVLCEVIVQTYAGSEAWSKAQHFLQSLCEHSLLDLREQKEFGFVGSLGKGQ